MPIMATMVTIRRWRSLRRRSSRIAWRLLVDDFFIFFAHIHSFIKKNFRQILPC